MPWQAIAEEARKHEVGQEAMRKARAFAKLYSAAEVVGLIDEAKNHRFPINVQVVVRLLRVPKPKRRAIQSKMFKEGWPIRRLDLEIYRLTRSHKAGRSIGVPGTSHEAYWELGVICRKFEKLIAAIDSMETELAPTVEVRLVKTKGAVARLMAAVVDRL